jgi:hypothetical protein
MMTSKMTLLDLMVFYRRAARARWAYNRLCARLKAIDLILMRLADIGRAETVDGRWNKAKMRVIQIALARRHEMETLRFEARSRKRGMS